MSPYAEAIRDGKDLNTLGALKSLFAGLPGQIFLVKAEPVQNGDGRFNLKVWYDAPQPLERFAEDDLKGHIAAHVAPVNTELVYHPVEKRNA